MARGGIFGTEGPDVEHDADIPVQTDSDKLFVPPFDKKVPTWFARTGGTALVCPMTNGAAPEAEGRSLLVTKGIRRPAVRSISRALGDRGGIRRAGRAKVRVGRRGTLKGTMVF